MITAAAVTLSLLQPPSAPAAAAPADATRAAVVQVDTRGFSPAFLPGKSNTDRAVIAFDADAPTVVKQLLHSAGLFGGVTTDAAGRVTWNTGTAGLEAWLAGGEAHRSSGPFLDKRTPTLDNHPDLPANWSTSAPDVKDIRYVELTIDLNAARTNAETLFDAPWLQHLLDRLSLNNARLVSLRASLNPPTADGLPPLLELKALASARSEEPGKAKPITLIAPGWGGTPAEAAAVKDANWAASIRADANGLGAIGRDGGVGTWAGLVRLAVDTVMTVNNDDQKKAQQQYTAWQDRTSDSLRPLASRLQPRATLACFGTAAKPDLVLIIPSRSGEQPDAFTRATEQFAKASGMTGKGGVFSVTGSGPLVPKLAITSCNAGGTPWLIATIEHDDARPMMRQTIERLTATK